MNSSKSISAGIKRDFIDLTSLYTTDVILSRLSQLGYPIHGYLPLSGQVIDDDHQIFDRLSIDDTSLFVITYSVDYHSDYFFRVKFSNHNYRFLLSGFINHDHALRFISDLISQDIPLYG